MQTFERSYNTIAPRTVDADGLGPIGNLQGGALYFSLGSGQVFNHLSKDFTMLKMPVNAINRIHFMAKKQKSVKGLRFGDMQNIIAHLISTGVVCEPENMQDLAR